MLPSATLSFSICFNPACASRATNSECKACGKLTWHGCGPLDGAKKLWQILLCSGIFRGFLTFLGEVLLAPVRLLILRFGILECNSTRYVFIPTPNEARLACDLYTYKLGSHAVFCTHETQHGAIKKRKSRQSLWYMHDSRVNASIKEVLCIR